MKIIFTGKKHILAFYAVIFAALCLLCLGLSAQNAVSASAKVKKLPIYAVNTTEKKIAITLDCAWENSDTQILLDIFDRNEIKATFFATGDFCERYNEDIKLIFSKGHAIENHSYNHPHVASISSEKLIADTKKCDAIIEELTGKSPSLYRAPYGEYSDKMLLTFEEGLQHKVIQWDVDVVTLKSNYTPIGFDMYHNIES